MQVTLDQWQAFISVVDAGGYAQAAEVLNKSQSSISYAINRLEHSLGTTLFRLEGRRARLTEAGEGLLRHARQLTEHAQQIEALATHFAQGWEAEIRLAVDSIFPESLILHVLNQFAEEQPQTRILLTETVLSGTDEALLRREADLVIGGRVPPGFIGQALMNVEFIAVAHPQHPLHQLNTPLTLEHLRPHRQLVVRDSGSRRLDAGWLGADQRWTFSNASTSIQSACLGLGFAWYPKLKIAAQLNRGELKPLPMETGASRFAQLYLVLSEGEFAGPGARRLAQLIEAEVKLRGYS
ncbi:MAG: LysR family transcriptional regulator [Nitrincola lacisaponensis]|uniref:LysR family transcriptional regulator n=1 Tax=Nitrincola lacisaponensis TaxID=267850 RepID=UPI00391C44EF